MYLICKIGNANNNGDQEKITSVNPMVTLYVLAKTIKSWKLLSNPHRSRTTQNSITETPHFELRKGFFSLKK